MKVLFYIVFLCLINFITRGQDVLRFHQTNGYDFQFPIFMNLSWSGDSVWIDDMNLIGYQQMPITSSPGSVISDIDGNQYPTIVLGNGQQWMAKNLNVTHFSNGDTINIPNWNSTSIIDWYSPASDDGDLITDFGKLYVNDVINDARNVCPAGWHVPTSNEWDLLIGYIDNNSNLGVVWGVVSRYGGGILKDSSSNYWIAPNGLATNSIGFNALPVSPIGAKASFWAVGNGIITGSGQTRILSFDSGIIVKLLVNHGQYNSIRCIKN
jgi:uncharacterized protein (TIGR02145 family)